MKVCEFERDCKVDWSKNDGLCPYITLDCVEDCITYKVFRDYPEELELEKEKVMVRE